MVDRDQAGVTSVTPVVADGWALMADSGQMSVSYHRSVGFISANGMHRTFFG